MIQILRLNPAEKSFCFSKQQSFKSINENSANMNKFNNLESFSLIIPNIRVHVRLGYNNDLYQAPNLTLYWKMFHIK